MAIALGRQLFFDRLNVPLARPPERCFCCSWRRILGSNCRDSLLLLTLGENRSQRAATISLLGHLLHQGEPLFLIGLRADHV